VVVAAELFVVDAFAVEPFRGNPAAVCRLDQEADGAWMQAVARELAMPATAFLAGRHLRWFTAVAELEVCGHGTLATAHVLHEAEGVERAEFTTLAGSIATVRERGSIFVELEAGASAEADTPDELRGLGAVSTWRTPLDYLLELDGPETVADLAPDFEAIARVEARGVIVTAAGGDGVDFTSRFFAPRLGLPEDNATGSAHASLAPFWAERLGRTELRARQASRRGGLLDLRVDGGKVAVGGPAVTVMRGRLLV
jgi:predicted PhzF superfamily epimerase YddE/YHI9